MADLLEGTRKNPILESGAPLRSTRGLRSRAGIVPRIADRAVTAEATGVVSDQSALLPDLNPLGVGPDLDRPPDGC